MAGYIGSKAVLLSTTAAEVSGDALITGNLKVDTIQKENGSVPTAKDLGLNISGNVLNHYYMNYSTGTSAITNSATWADTGLTLDVTPTASNSKFLIQWQLFIYYTGKIDAWSASQARLLRSGTVIKTDGYGLGRGGLYNVSSVNCVMMINSGDLTHDSPSTTSSVTYKIQHVVYDSTVYLQNGGQQSYLSIIEIAG